MTKLHDSTVEALDTWHCFGLFLIWITLYAIHRESPATKINWLLASVAWLIYFGAPLLIAKDHLSRKLINK